MGILVFLATLLLVALPLGVVSRITFFLTVSFSLLDVLLFFGSFFWLGKKLLEHERPKSVQAFAFLAVTVIFILSLFLNLHTLVLPQVGVAALYIVRWLILGLLFFIVKETRAENKKKIPYLLLAGGMLLTIGGYIQYFLYPALRNLIYFGWDEHLYRMFGTFLDPNFFGLFLVLFFLFILSCLFALQSHKQKLLFALYFILALFVFIAIFLTYSRTALIALAIGIIVLFWKRNFWKWFWIFLLAGGITTFLVVPPSARQTVGNNLLRVTSAQARLGSAQNALTIFMDSPIIGVGFNAYRYSVYRHHFQSGSSTQEDHGASGADSSILLVLATSGIIGLTGFLFYFATHVARLVKAERIGLATLIAFFVGSFFVNGLFYPLLLVWVWTVLGITET